MTIHHAIWPEGLPDRATHTTSWWRAHWIKLKLQTHYLWHVRSARRVRHAISDEGAPNPHSAELMLQEMGAIAPPGGWPSHDERATAGVGGVAARVFTHSVV